MKQLVAFLASCESQLHEGLASWPLVWTRRQTDNLIIPFHFYARFCFVLSCSAPDATSTQLANIRVLVACIQRLLTDAHGFPIDAESRLNLSACVRVRWKTEHMCHFTLIRIATLFCQLCSKHFLCVFNLFL